MDYAESYSEHDVVARSKPIRWIDSVDGTWQQRARAGQYIDSQGGDANEVLRQKLVVMHHVIRHDATPSDTPADLIFAWVGTLAGDVGIYWNWRQYAHVNLTVGQMVKDYADLHWGCKEAGLDDEFIAGIAKNLQVMVDAARTLAGLDG